jgi:ferredoxin/coenzyme F420-reducing hydrogenase delta subunit
MRDTSPASLRQHGLNVWRAAERIGDAAFGSAFNPLRHLGAIGFFAFWALAASGVVLYTVLDTSVAGAWHSIHALSDVPLGLGVLLRGVHRYAADLMVVATALHLVREWLHGHERGVRRFAWLTGVPLVGFVLAIAIGGFWINWDQLGQYSAIATAEWLDALPLLSAPMARNFLGADAVGDRLFSLFVFVHIGLPLLLVFGLWFHVQRLTRPAVWPPRALALGFGTLLAALALGVPIASHAPAALAHVPESLRLDWILLFLHPLTDATSPRAVWMLVGGAALLLFALPFLPVRTHDTAGPAAVVDAANCNGCQRCFADCPYAAITMVPHPSQRIGRTLAAVDADLCVSCGICAGACPSSTPFRSVATLVTGIDMPQRPVGALRQRLHAALRDAHGERRIVVFGCDRGADVARLDGADVSAFSLLCAGQLPPSFVEYALRDGAAAVLVAACREGGCEYRTGGRVTTERLCGEREPHLRPAVRSEPVELAFVGPGEQDQIEAALERLRARVRPRATDLTDPSRWRHA